MKRNTVTRLAATAFAALLLTLAGAAMAAADSLVDDGKVDVNVEVSARYPSGVLALSVAADNATLSEVDSGDPLVREFTGELPMVTVTDTRSDVPDVPWYVLGTASDFVSGSDVISAEHLGWTPSLAADYGSAIEPGGDIETVIDDPGSEGLSYADGELLYVNWDEVDTYQMGTWSASAGLQFKVSATTVTPGSYTSVLTLSLFE